MSYIEDGVWKMQNGSPVMTVPTGEDIEVHHFDTHLAVFETGWCDECQNPAIRWVLYDFSGEAVSQSIGAHTTMEAAIEDASDEADNLS